MNNYTALVPDHIKGWAQVTRNPISRKLFSLSERNHGGLTCFHNEKRIAFRSTERVALVIGHVEVRLAIGLKATKTYM
jgi:hypothetical protein